MLCLLFWPLGLYVAYKLNPINPALFVFIANIFWAAILSRLVYSLKSDQEKINRCNTSCLKWLSIFAPSAFAGYFLYSGDFRFLVLGFVSLAWLSFLLRVTRKVKEQLALGGQAAQIHFTFYKKVLIFLATAFLSVCYFYPSWEYVVLNMIGLGWAAIYVYFGQDKRKDNSGVFPEGTSP